VSKHNPGVVLFHCDIQLVFEELETRRNASSTECFPTDGPTLAPQTCKDHANTAQQNIERFIVMHTATLSTTSFYSWVAWVSSLGARTFHWCLLLQAEYFLKGLAETAQLYVR